MNKFVQNLCTDRNGRRVMSYGKKRKRKREFSEFLDGQYLSGSATVGSTLIFYDNGPNVIVLEDNPTLEYFNETLKRSNFLSKNMNSMILAGGIFFVATFFAILIPVGLKLYKLRSNKN